MPVTRDVSPLDDLVEGLDAPQKRVDSKYFYDQRGSELFDEITTLPEYYLTRAELALLERHAEALVQRLRPVTLLELGAGSARKTRLLLGPLAEHVSDATYVPLDVSELFLAETARELRAEYPGLRVTPVAADFTQPLDLHEALAGPALVALLGSTIGNFDDARAAEILGHATRWMEGGDHLLLGVDLRPGPEKSREELEAAYDDARGVTAAFNLNLLDVLNTRFGTDFDRDAFEHLALYDEERGRIEMHLRARGPTEARIPGGPAIRFEAGETLRTEISRKYDRAGVEALFRRAGLELLDWMADDGRYALALGVVPG